MPIEVTCPNCCRITLKDKYGGKKVRCPKCKRTLRVPQAVLSEDAVMDLLGVSDFRPSHAPPEPQAEDDEDTPSAFATVLVGAEVMESVHVCPSCRKEVPANFRVCPHCRMYIAGANDNKLISRTRCPACGTGIIPGEVNCATCGADLRLA